MTALVLKNLSKVYGNGAHALDNLSLEVGKGELLVLLGPSGSGKSTALRLIAGLESPTGGDIFIDGKRANDIPPRDRDIAMVFQDYALYPHFNVAQNLGFGLKMRRFPKSEIKKRISEIAEMLGMADLLERKPKELSGGQRQRVALGRALVRNPKIFLFDEPLSNLDPTLRVQLRQEIKQIHDSLAATMVYVTHDQHEAMLMGQKIAILRAGVLEQVGTPAELYCNPANSFVAGFFGSPPINLIDGEAAAAHDRLEVTCGNGKSFRLPISGSPDVTALQSSGSQTQARIRIGFRPEDVRIGRGGENNAMSGTASLMSLETLGGETLLHMEDAGMQFCVRALGFLSGVPGEKFSYSIPLEKLHLFDAATGQRLC